MDTPNVTVPDVSVAQKEAPAVEKVAPPLVSTEVQGVSQTELNVQGTPVFDRPVQPSKASTGETIAPPPLFSADEIMSGVSSPAEVDEMLDNGVAPPPSMPAMANFTRNKGRAVNIPEPPKPVTPQNQEANTSKPTSFSAILGGSAFQNK